MRLFPIVRPRTVTLGCLVVLYLVWGSTYLAIRIAVQSFAPLQMAAIRFMIAGALLYAFLRARGAPSPTWREWRSCAAIGVLMMAIGLGGVSIVVKHVSSGVAALVFGSVPLWTALFGRLFGQRLRAREALGMVLGLTGVLLVATRGGLRGAPLAAAILCASAASYSLGCALARRVPQPRGAMSTAAQMLVAGAVLTIASLARGESIATDLTIRSIAALAHLIALGSIVAYSALNHLLRTERASVATSYAFVNPVVALGLGAAFEGERVTGADWIGVGMVIAAVAVVTGRVRTSERRGGSVDVANVTRS